jgi:hypothetical protein
MQSVHSHLVLRGIAGLDFVGFSDPEFEIDFFLVKIDARMM